MKGNTNERMDIENLVEHYRYLENVSEKFRVEEKAERELVLEMELES